jgi:hypothetical protein
MCIMYRMEQVMSHCIPVSRTPLSHCATLDSVSDTATEPPCFRLRTYLRIIASDSAVKIFAHVVATKQAPAV